MFMAEVASSSSSSIVNWEEIKSSSLGINFFHLFGKVTAKIKGELDEKLFYIIGMLNVGT